MPAITIPENLTHAIAELCGKACLEWLVRLPSLVADYAEQWLLTVLAPFEPLSYNYVALAVHVDGTDVVLKEGSPTLERCTEIDALRFVCIT